MFIKDIKTLAKGVDTKYKQHNIKLINNNTIIYNNAVLIIFDIAR